MSCASGRAKLESRRRSPHRSSTNARLLLSSSAARNHGHIDLDGACPRSVNAKTVCTLKRSIKLVVRGSGKDDRASAPQPAESKPLQRPAFTCLG